LTKKKQIVIERIWSTKMARLPQCGRAKIQTLWEKYQYFMPDTAQIRLTLVKTFIGENRLDRSTEAYSLAYVKFWPYFFKRYMEN
jgi:hypothetical protein